MLQNKKDDLALLLKQQKVNPANISALEKQFEFEKQRFNNFYGTLPSPGEGKLVPGRISEHETDEAWIADILLQPMQTNIDQDTMVQLDSRIRIKQNQLRSMRL